MAKIQLKKCTPIAIWNFLGMDQHTLLMMLKGGLPPTIVIAMLQATPVSNLIQNYSYVAAIISVISQCLLPRAKFMKILLFCVVATCASASVCCLGIFCAVTARQHTSPPGAADDDYNSSACTVAAIWLLFGIWIGNTIRAYRPTELQSPMSSFSIFIAFSMTRAGQIATVSSGLAFVRQMLLAFLIGFAIAAGVSLCILPVTSRSNFVHGIRKYPNFVKSLLDTQIAYVRCSESDGPWKLTRRATIARLQSRQSMQRQDTGLSEGKQAGQAPALSESDSKAAELKAILISIRSVHSAANAELYYAKQEFVWSKLTAEDLDKLFELLRSVFLPLTGIAMLPEVFKKLTKRVGAATATAFQGGGVEPIAGGIFTTPFGGDDQYEIPEAPEAPQVSDQHFIRPLCDRLEAAAKLVNSGLQHGFITLELAKAKDFDREKKRGRKYFPGLSEEAPDDITEPGHPDFAIHFERQMYEIYSRRKHLPETWANLNAFNPLDTSEENRASESKGVQKEFFVLLFIGHLQDVLLQAVFDFVKFADSKVADGTMKSRRFLFPKRENLIEWLFDVGPDEDDEKEDSQMPIRGKKTANDKTYTRFRDPLKSRYSDPEHLPPANSWQKFGNILRRISHFLSSDQSAFGFRVAVASFSAAILAYLRATQDFFYQNRINWVVIVIVIGMSPTSGHSMFGLAGRVFGTTVSTALGLVVWYMVAGNTAGIIVFLYVANCLHYYFYVKFPRFIPACIIALITFNLIISYELSVRKLGVEKATSTGLSYFPIYLFGPYRLVAVMAGCAISFFWVVFPCPSSAGSQVRKSLGRSLFVLANFYSCMHTTIEIWINQEQGDINDSQSPARLLERARGKLLAEELSLLANLRTNSDFTKYEPSIGGEFPKKTFDDIISEIQTILTSMDLMAHATRNLERLSVQESIEHASPNRHGRRGSSRAGNGKSSHGSMSSRSSSVDDGDRGDSGVPGNEEKWIHNLAKAASSPDFHSHVVTSVLYHLSAAVSNRLSLPPYLAPPHPFPLARRLRQMDEDLLNIRNIEDPSFSAFVAVEVLSSMVSSNLKNLMSDVKSLVGELNFDIYVKRHRRKIREEKIRSSERGDSRRRGEA